MDNGYIFRKYNYNMVDEKLLIYGAGALGRGFLAPTFSKIGYKIYFVDKDEKLVKELQKRNLYKTAFSTGNGHEICEVKYEKAFLLGEEDNFLSQMDLVFSCVGPRNFNDFAYKLSKVPTIYSFENERESVEKIKELSRNSNCFFGIPDVISSNDSSKELLEKDPLCLITEKGKIVLEKSMHSFPEEIICVSEEELKKHWYCKFYLHNMPHAVVSFSGKLFGKKYVHESMEIPSVKELTFSAMESIKNSLIKSNFVDKEMAEYYSKKELHRFSDKYLNDPISRVARDPIRKLRKNDRLIQSAKIIQENQEDIIPLLKIINIVLYDTLTNYSLDLISEGIGLTMKDILLKISELKEDDSLFLEIFKFIKKQTSLRKIELNVEEPKEIGILNEFF